MPPKKKSKAPQTLRIISGLCRMPWDEAGLHYRMRMDYNEVDGIQTYISKQDGDWVLHSCPFPSKLPKKELDAFIRIFKRSVQGFNPRVKFKAELI